MMKTEKTNMIHPVNDLDPDEVLESGIKNAKLCISRIVKMHALKWDPVDGATCYVVSFSNGLSKQSTTKPVFQLPDDFDVQKDFAWVQAFKGAFPLTRKHPFRHGFYNLVMLG